VGEPDGEAAGIDDAALVEGTAEEQAIVLGLVELAIEAESQREADAVVTFWLSLANGEHTRHRMPKPTLEQKRIYAVELLRQASPESRLKARTTGW
jgi:hypothetical protein